MLSRPHRLTQRNDFAAVMRSGKRAGRARVVVHALQRSQGSPPKVGLIVSKSVGGSVVRHGVSRKLRHVMRDVTPGLPTGTVVVLRALAPASTSSSAELAADVHSAMTKLGLPCSSTRA